MIYVNRKKKQEVLTHYLYYVDGFIIDWWQSINKKEEVVGIRGFNQRKSFYKYKKKGYGDGMYRRILKLSRNRKK